MAPSQVASVSSQKPHAASPAMPLSSSKISVTKQPSTTPRPPNAADSTGQRGASANRHAAAITAASRPGRPISGATVSDDSGNANASQQAERRQPESSYLRTQNHVGAPIRRSVHLPIRSIRATRLAAMIAAANSAAQICTVCP